MMAVTRSIGSMARSIDRAAISTIAAISSTAVGRVRGIGHSARHGNVRPAMWAPSSASSAQGRIARKGRGSALTIRIIGKSFSARICHLGPGLKQCCVTAMVLVATGCGHTPSRLGVLVDMIGVTQSGLGPSPQDVASREFLQGSLLRAKPADVAGDATPELLVEIGDGKGIEIRDQAGRVLSEIRTPQYLTDFGAIAAPDSPKSLLVLYTYPNAQRGGTFTVMTEGKVETATWDEYPPTGRFGVGEWRGHPALFYLQDDSLIIRSPTGALLQRLPAPQGHLFRELYVRAVANGRTAVVATGNGYTPYHMVSIYDSDRLLF